MGPKGECRGRKAAPSARSRHGGRRSPRRIPRLGNPDSVIQS